MTREQAIKHLEVIKGDCALVGDIRALDIAISALSADGEYIKKEDAINSTYFAPTYYDPLNVLTEARDKIKELRTYSLPDSENKGEWIPVSKRLPEIGHVVYCQLTDGSHEILFLNECEGRMTWVGRRTGTYNVTAWREMPESYKGE